MKVISLSAYAGMAVLIGWYAKQQNKGFAVSGATALAFIELNPLVLLEAIGNGHNDITMAAFITLGLILWQRGKWAWVALALTLAALVKLPALMLIPLFGLSVLMDSPTWKERLTRAIGLAAMVLGGFFVSYRLMWTLPQRVHGNRPVVRAHKFFARLCGLCFGEYVLARTECVVLPNTRYVFLFFYTVIASR